MTSGKLLALAPFTAVLCPVYGEEINVSIYQIFRAQLGYKDWREEIRLRSFYLRTACGARARLVEHILFRAYLGVKCTESAASGTQPIRLTWPWAGLYRGIP